VLDIINDSTVLYYKNKALKNDAKRKKWKEKEKKGKKAQSPFIEKKWCQYPVASASCLTGELSTVFPETIKT
jgi:hypothetical protein